MHFEIYSRFLYFIVLYFYPITFSEANISALELYIFRFNTKQTVHLKPCFIILLFENSPSTSSQRKLVSLYNCYFLTQYYIFILAFYRVRLRPHQNSLAVDLRILPMHCYRNAADFLRNPPFWCGCAPRNYGYFY